MLGMLSSVFGFSPTTGCGFLTSCQIGRILLRTQWTISVCQSDPICLHMFWGQEMAPCAKKMGIWLVALQLSPSVMGAPENLF